MEVSWRDYVDLRFTEWEKTHDRQLDTAQRALESAAESLRERLDHQNKFREQIEAERALYVRREQMDAVLASRAAIVEQLISRLDKLENWQSNVLGRQLIFGGAVIVIAGIVTLALRLVGH